MILSTIEIALLIMLPLIFIFQRSSWKLKEYVPSIVIIYLVWYFTYALFHELMHMSGAWIFNKTIFEFQLIPKFWKGEFGTGYINYDYKGDSMDFIIILLPYARDIVFLIVGYFIIIKMEIRKPFVLGLVLVLLILSPLYDIGNNYSAYLLGYMNDFNALGESSSMIISHLIGISFFLTSTLITLLIIKKLKDYPIQHNN